MKVKSITLENVRAFEKATFEFGDGMNLIVGVNGVGKSTVLDALRFSFSRVLPLFSVPVSKQHFTGADIRNRTSGLKINFVVEFEGIDFIYNLDYPRVQFETVAENTGKVRGQTKATPLNETLEPPAKALQYERWHHILEAPPLLALYFSPRRSVMTKRLAAKLPTFKQTESPTAFDRALIPRESNLTDFIEWWLRARKLSTPWGDVQLIQLEKVISTFLTGYHDLRPGNKGASSLYIKKGKVMLDVERLSDGEKSVLALVIELTRRLSQANPNTRDPSTEASAVVLIDELDLHLHPGWQREIVGKLTRTFPKCQFICSTHSPQIIGEVEPENVSFIEEGQAFNQAQTLGLSSEWITEYLMGSSTRNEEAKTLIKTAEQYIEQGQLDEARQVVKDLRSYLRGPDGVVVRLNASINSLQSIFDEASAPRKKASTTRKKPNQD